MANSRTAGNDPKLTIHPLGGCGEFGMNATVYAYGNRHIIVDCGIMFSEPTKLGTDGLFPSPGESLSDLGAPEAYIITHGHEDHIGAICYYLQSHPAPVYATDWTLELIRLRAGRIGFDVEPFLNRVDVDGGKVVAGPFQVQYVRVNHSIPMTCALVITTESARIFHTGDFKFDPNSQFEPPVTPDSIAALNLGPIDILLADSTNAGKAGPTPGEAQVVDPLSDHIKRAKGTVYLTTFSSNLWRLINVYEICKSLGKQLLVAGNSMEQTINIGRKLNLFSPEPGTLILEDEVQGVPSSNLVVLTTGCQGEWRAGMTRIAFGEHRLFRLTPNDLVIFSSRIIPGNEKSIYGILDRIVRAGATAITVKEDPSIHVSGHAYQSDLVGLISALKPKYFVPIHGTIQHQVFNAACAQQGTLKPPVVIPTSGDVLCYTNKGLDIASNLERSNVFVDSESRRLMDLETLRQRLRIGYNGLAIINGVYSPAQQNWVKPPSIVFQGIPLPEPATSAAFAKKIESMTAKLAAEFATDEDLLNEEARVTVRRSLFELLGKKPVVISLIQSV